MRTWTQRSHLVAALGGGLLLAALLVFALGPAYRTPMLRVGFPAAAIAFHAGLGLAIVAGLREERGAGLALALNGAPVLLFWGSLYLLVKALSGG